MTTMQSQSAASYAWSGNLDVSGRLQPTERFTDLTGPVSRHRFGDDNATTSVMDDETLQFDMDVPQLKDTLLEIANAGIPIRGKCASFPRSLPRVHAPALLCGPL